MKFTAATIKKMESLFEDLGYTVRFEKGNFQSGYCLVEARKVLVINKFFDVEGRGNCMLDILTAIQVDTELLQPDNLTLYRKFFPSPDTQMKLL